MKTETISPLKIDQVHEEVGNKMIKIFGLESVSHFNRPAYNSQYGLKSNLGIGRTISQDLTVDELEEMIKDKLVSKIVRFSLNRSYLVALKGINTTSKIFYLKKDIYRWDEAVLSEQKIEILKLIVKTLQQQVVVSK